MEYQNTQNDDNEKRDNILLAHLKQVEGALLARQEHIQRELLNRLSFVEQNMLKALTPVHVQMQQLTQFVEQLSTITAHGQPKTLDGVIEAKMIPVRAAIEAFEQSMISHWVETMGGLQVLSQDITASQQHLDEMLKKFPDLDESR